MKNEIIKIAQNLEQGTITENEARNILLGLFGVSGSLFCHLKETADNELILVIEIENGLKYIIASDDLISYGRVGKNIGESECVHFDNTNGKTILHEWSK